MTWLRHEIGAYLLFSDGVDAMRGFGRQNGQGHALGLGLRLACVSALALGLANCASKPGRKGAGSSEIGAFSDPKYGKASPRVVGIDQDAPKGGGRYQVGNPYSVAGKRYVPREKPVGYTISGNASWYGVAFHGRKTANGEVYDRNSISAAHPTMPLPSYARVTNLTNNHSIVVRVNDRGPYHGGRVLDVSERAAGLLEFKQIGTARVKVDYLGPAALAGSDDARLVASLRRNGPAASPFRQARYRWPRRNRRRAPRSLWASCRPARIIRPARKQGRALLCPCGSPPCQMCRCHPRGPSTLKRLAAQRGPWQPLFQIQARAACPGRGKRASPLPGRRACSRALARNTRFRTGAKHLKRSPI